jgi:hypothetical protein
MNTGSINRSIIEEMPRDILQPKFLTNSKMHTNPPHQSSGVINSPNRSAKKIGFRKISADSYRDMKNGAVDIEVHSTDKRSRANSSFKSERDHSNKAKSERDHSNPARSTGSGKSKNMKKMNSIEDYGMVDYLMNDQTLLTPKKHKEHICKKKGMKYKKKQGPCRQDTEHVPENCDHCIEYKYKGSKTSKTDPHNE